MPLPSGSRFGPYQIIGLVGRGGMGEVYRAHDARLGRDVALKILPDDVASSPERLARFETEVRAAGALAHPNIVATYDVGVSDGVPFVVMELLKGVTLREKLDAARSDEARTDGRFLSSAIHIRGLSMDCTLQYGVQIACGVAAVHAGGFVHRDLKPSNVFITDDGCVKVLDFGLAKVQGPIATGPANARGTADTITVPGAPLGTVNYMAPEQVRGQTVDPRGDIFAIGVLMFEMLSGSRPFDRETPADTMSAILNVDVPDLRINLEASATARALFRIISRCLEKRPEARFQSASDLLFALEQVRDGSGRVDPLTAEPGPLAWAAGSSHRRRAWVMAASAFLLGGAVVWVMVARRAPATVTGPLAARFEVRLPQASSAALWVSLAPRGDAVVIGGGGGQTWVHSLDNGETRELVDTPATGLGGWSPDGREFLMMSQGRLVRADAGGRGTRPLTDVAGFGGAIWHGEEIVYSDGGAIKKVSALGGVPVVECAPAGELTALVGPAGFVDNSHFLFLGRSTKPEQTGVYAAAVDEPCDPKFLIAADTWPKFIPPDRLFYTRNGALYAQTLDPQTLDLVGDPLRLADDLRTNPFQSRAVFDVTPGTLVYRTSGTATPRQLRLVDRAGRTIQDIGTPALYRHPSFARDGMSFLVARSGTQFDIASFDIATNIATPLTSGPPARYPRWSPDGRLIAYAEETASGFNLVVQPARLGGPKRVLFHSRTLLAVHDWSPDGRYVLFEDGDADGRADLYAIAVNGETSPFVVSNQPGYDTSGAFSPDGRYVAYLASGFQVFIKSFPDGEVVRRISGTDGRGPRWNPNGRELFFVEPEASVGGWRLMSVPFQSAGNHETPMVGTPVPVFRARFYFAGDVLNLGAPYDVAANGQRFLILESTRDIVEPLTVVLNWPRLIARP